MITFLDNHSFYCNITFLCKKSEAAEAVKSIFHMWSNITFYPMKRLHTDNEEEYVMSELQFFLRKQGVIYKTNILHVHQQNGYAEQLNCILLKKAQSI